MLQDKTKLENEKSQLTSTVKELKTNSLNSNAKLSEVLSDIEHKEKLINSLT